MFFIALSLTLLATGFAVPLHTADGTRTLSSGIPENCGISHIKSQAGGKIVGGRDAKYGEYPWQVMLQMGSDFNGWQDWCGGVILNERHVLTAVHCTFGHTKQYFQVVVGAHDLSQPNGLETVHKIKGIIPANFTDPPFRGKLPRSLFIDDIVLLRLAEPIDFSKYGGMVNAICLPDKNYDPSGKMATVTGWGALHEEGFKYPDVLQTVDVKVQKQKKCLEVLGEYYYNEETTICAGVPEGGKDACGGDSGGPLTQQVDGRATLVGLVSWGIGCARPGYPGVYTKVTHYVDWLHEAIVKT